MTSPEPTLPSLPGPQPSKCTRCAGGDHHWTPVPVEDEFACFCCLATAEAVTCESCSLPIPATGAVHDLEDGVYICRACQDAVTEHFDDADTDVIRSFQKKLGEQTLAHEAQKQALELEAAALTVKKAQLEADTAEIIKQHAVKVSEAFSLPKIGDLS